MIQELHAGDRQIPASGWNEIRAAVQGITPGQQQYQSGRFNPAYVTISNQTGYDLPAFAVVKIDGATYNRSGDAFRDLAVKNGVELDGDIPDDVTNMIAITQAACAAGELVKAMVSGASACYINKPSGVTCNYAKIAAGYSDYLTGTDTPTGIKVLWSAGGTGKKEAIVRLGTFIPQYITNATVYASGVTPLSTIACDIDGVTYPVLFPGASDGLSAPNYPDIYPGDNILVCVDFEGGYCYAVDYPTDYEGGTLMAFYSGQGSPGRGWDAITTSQAMTDAGFTLYQKTKTGALL